MTTTYKNRCAKRHVIARVVTVGGEEFYGTNAIRNPAIAECPRKEGEGYTKCATICGQFGHAELVALIAAGEKAKGGTLHVYGHDHMCDECKDATKAAGIAKVEIHYNVG